MIVQGRGRRAKFHALPRRTFRLDSGRGEQIELLVAHAAMMSRPIGLSNAVTDAVHFSRSRICRSTRGSGVSRKTCAIGICSCTQAKDHEGQSRRFDCAREMSGVPPITSEFVRRTTDQRASCRLLHQKQTLGAFIITRTCRCAYWQLKANQLSSGNDAKSLDSGT